MNNEDIKADCLSYIVLGSIARYVLGDGFNLDAGDGFLAKLYRFVEYHGHFEGVLMKLFHRSTYKQGSFSEFFDAFVKEHSEKVVKELKEEMLDSNQVNFPNYFNGYGDFPRLKSLGNVNTKVDFERELLGYDIDMLGDGTDWVNKNIDGYIEARFKLYTELCRKLGAHPFIKWINDNAETKDWRDIADCYFVLKYPVLEDTMVCISSNDLYHAEYKLVRLIFMSGVATAIYVHITSSDAINNGYVCDSLKKLNRAIKALEKVIPFVGEEAGSSLCPLAKLSGYPSILSALLGELNQQHEWLKQFKLHSRRNPHIGFLALRLYHALHEVPERHLLCQKIVRLILCALVTSYDEDGVKRWIDGYSSIYQ